MNKDIIISVLVSVVISGLFSFYLFNGKIGMNQAPKSQLVVLGEAQSVSGSISEIKDSGYVINTNEGAIVSVIVNPETTYATSFSPTPSELEDLYGTATSAPGDKPLIQKLKLKVGDRIEATSNTSMAGKTEFTATVIKLIR